MQLTVLDIGVYKTVLATIVFKYDIPRNNQKVLSTGKHIKYSLFLRTQQNGITEIQRTSLKMSKGLSRGEIQKYGNLA